MKWKLSLPGPPKLVYYFAKLIGLAPFTIKNGIFHPPNFLNRVYLGFLMVINVGIVERLLVGVFEYHRADSTMFRNNVAIIRCINKIPTTSIAIITFSLRDKKILDIMKKLCAVGKELKKLGIDENHEKFFKSLLIKIAITNAILIAALVVTIANDPNLTILPTIEYSLTSWFDVNSCLILTQTLAMIRERFKLINERLQDVFDPNDHLRSHRNRRVFVMSRSLREGSESRIEDLTPLQLIRKIEALHMMLCDLVYRMTNLFAVPILSQGLRNSGELLLGSYWLYRIFCDSPQLHSTAETLAFLIFPLCILIRMAITMSQLIAIAEASASTCEEGNSATAVVFRTCYKFTRQQLEDEFVMFSLQLGQRPVVVSAFGLFNLDYMYPFQIICTVVAYLIIAIQFEMPKPNPGS